MSPLPDKTERHGTYLSRQERPGNSPSTQSSACLQCQGHCSPLCSIGGKTISTLELAIGGDPFDQPAAMEVISLIIFLAVWYPGAACKGGEEGAEGGRKEREGGRGGEEREEERRGTRRGGRGRTEGRGGGTGAGRGRGKHQLRMHTSTYLSTNQDGPWHYSFVRVLLHTWNNATHIDIAVM